MIIYIITLTSVLANYFLKIHAENKNRRFYESSQVLEAHQMLLTEYYNISVA